MNHTPLASQDWQLILDRLGGAEAIESSARRAKAFLRAREIPNAAALLRRIHSAFDLPAERFEFFELTDQHGGERLDRIPVEKGEIRIADRAYMQPERIAAVIGAGGDVVVRAGWKSAGWLDGAGNRFDLI